VTGLDYIKAAMRLAQVLGQGETPDADSANDALSLANAMLGGWSIERLAVFHFQTEELAWAAGQASRTIGSGGQLNTTRPTRIESAYHKDAAGLASPLTPIASERYRGITDKAAAGTPEWIFLDAAYPLATLHAYPVDAAAWTLGLATWRQFTAMTLAAEYALPPGYDELLRYQLALRIADEWNRPIRPSVLRIAEMAMDRIKTLNIQIPLVESDLDGYGSAGFDILSGGA
jgi:hypothetical protein